MRGRWVDRLTLALVCAAILAAPSSWAQGLGPESALQRLCGNASPASDWFARSFLAQVPFSSLQQILSALRTDLGACQRVERRGQEFVLIFARGVVIVPVVSVDGEGRFTSLVVQPRAAYRSAEEAVAALRTLPGSVSLVVLQNGRTMAVLNPDAPLAVGSAFKLSVLAALREQIDAGKHTWHESLPVRPEWKSLPSGVLQDFPDNATVTVRTAAELMIARSDNTATDLLIRMVGRDAVEAAAPDRNRPFLMTREAFILKDPRNAALLARWRAGNEAARRAMFGEISARPLPDLRSFAAAFARGPLATDVEWFYTGRELCAVMARVADMTAMRINPGVATKSEWKAVAFKGGSEPGVFNLTTQTERDDGRSFCVAATWNDTSPVLDLRLYTIYTGLLDLLRR